jgi:chromosome segregation ATPase
MSKDLSDPKPDSPTPVCWRREWQGDDSDLGAFVHADNEGELDEHGPWEALYSEQDVRDLQSALSAAQGEVERLKVDLADAQKTIVECGFGRAAQALATERERREAMQSALKELVRLKDLIDDIERTIEGHSPRWREYCQQKPLAWKAARAALEEHGN